MRSAELNAALATDVISDIPVRCIIIGEASGRWDRDII